MSELKDMAIYDAIEALVEYIYNCPNGMLTSAKKTVVVEEIESLINDIKLNIPEDVSRAQAVISEAETYLDDANRQANEILNKANSRASNIEKRAKSKADEIIANAEMTREHMVSEHEILIAAQKEATSLMNNTEQACTTLYENAKVEADELLAEVEECFNACLNRVETDRERIGARRERTRCVSEVSVDATDNTSYAEEDSREEEARYVPESRSKAHKDSFMTRVKRFIDSDDDDEDYDDDLFDSYDDEDE